MVAVLVRHNRGMPTLEWKSLNSEKRKDLTASIVAVTTEYDWIIGMIAAVLVGLVPLSAIGKGDAALWPAWARRVASGAVGGLANLSTARIALCCLAGHRHSLESVDRRHRIARDIGAAGHVSRRHLRQPSQRQRPTGRS